MLCVLNLDASGHLHPHESPVIRGLHTFTTLKILQRAVQSLQTSLPECKCV